MNEKDVENIYVPPYVTYEKNERVCRLSNYKPYKTPSNANRQEWHYAYGTQLVNIYDIICNNIKDRYPKNKIKWKSNEEKIFHNVSRLIYSTSSKYILPELRHDLV